MENETSSVVEVSAGTGIKVIRASLTPGKANVEKELSETPPLAHSQAAHVQSNTPPPVVSQPAGFPLGIIPDNNKTGPSRQQVTPQPPQVNLRLGRCT